MSMLLAFFPAFSELARAAQVRVSAPASLVVLTVPAASRRATILLYAMHTPPVPAAVLGSLGPAQCGRHGSLLQRRRALGGSRSASPPGAAHPL